MAGQINLQGALRTKYHSAVGLQRDDGQFEIRGPEVYSVEGSVSLSELNAGRTILSGVTGRRFLVTGFFLRFVGTFATATDIRLGTTESTPTVVVTVAIAQATDGARHSEDAGTNTLGAGFLASLAAGHGLQIYKTGANATGGTSITFRVLYKIVG